MPTIKVLKVTGKNIDIETHSIDKDNNVKMGNNEDLQIPLESDNVFNLALKKFKNKMPIKRKPAVIYVNGKRSFERIKTAKKKTKNEKGEEIETDFQIEGLSNKDRKLVVRRLMIRTLARVKPMTMTQFVVLAGLMLANLIILLLVGKVF